MHQHQRSTYLLLRFKVKTSNEGNDWVLEIKVCTEEEVQENGTYALLYSSSRWSRSLSRITLIPKSKYMYTEDNIIKIREFLVDNSILRERFSSR